MANPKYTLNRTGAEIDNILTSAETHVVDANIHVTSQEKTTWNAKANSDLTNIDNATFKSKVETSGFTSGTLVKIIDWEEPK